MEKYEPELGQAGFGQPWQAFKLSENLELSLNALAVLWDVMRDDGNPFQNTSARYNGEKFTIHAYSWDDTVEQTFNFKWRDLQVSWYKGCGRGMSCNREVSDKECREMLMEAIGELYGLSQSMGK